MAPINHTPDPCTPIKALNVVDGVTKQIVGRNTALTVLGILLLSGCIEALVELKRPWWTAGVPSSSRA